MEVRCIDDLGMTVLEVGSVYEGKLKFDHWNKEKRWYLEGEKFRKFCFREKAFEVVKEEKEMQEKTFIEVIKDIKEGEVWESHCKRIIGNGDGDFKIESKSGGDFGSYVAIRGENKYRLKRKEYTFEEAFKAYENGKVIESCVTGDKYTWNGFTDLICKNGADGYSKLKSIYIEEIKGKWYINN